MMPICLGLRVKCSIMYMYVYVTHSNKVSSHKKQTCSWYSTFFSQSDGNRFALRLSDNYVECKGTYAL